MPMMGTRARWLLLWAAVLGCGAGGAVARGRVWLDETGAYRDIVLAIHPTFIPTNCSAFFTNLKAALTTFSRRLWRASRGQVHLGQVKLVVPAAVSQACALLPTARATWQRWNLADILLSPGLGWRWGPEGSVGVRVSQPEGCTRPGQRIILDPHILHNLHQDHHLLHTLGGSLVAAWARYRWGVFEERGYQDHPRYPAAYFQDQTLRATACTNALWTSTKWSGECGEDDDISCTWIPHTPAIVNTSLLYRSDLPQMWGFCDDGSHDPDAPTPHNLLCGARSVWHIVSQHPDFARNSSHTPAHHRMAPTPAYSLKELLDNDKDNISNADDAMETNNITMTNPEEERSHFQPVTMNGRLPLHDRNWLVIDNNTVPPDNVSGTFIPPQTNVKHETLGGKRKTREKSLEETVDGHSPEGAGDGRSPEETGDGMLQEETGDGRSPEETGDGMLQEETGDGRSPEETGDGRWPREPSLVMARSSMWHSHNLVATHQDNNTHNLRHVKMEGIEAASEPQEARPLVWTPPTPDSTLPPQEWTLPPQEWTPSPPEWTLPPPEWIPPAPDLMLLAPAPSALILALDLSDQAVAQVNVDTLRGGILRWLWSLGADVRVGVLAAYNNASYPLTIGSLLPAPTTASELEDELTFLPSGDEVEHGVYGGEYCLTCVLAEAAKMLEVGGVEAGAGVMLLAACSPMVSLANLAHATHANFSIHTFVLCPTTEPLFDQLAGSGGSWVLLGPTLTGKDNLAGEQEVAFVLTAATRIALATPGDPTLVRVGGSLSKVSEVDVMSGGPYSTVTGRVTIPPAHDYLLMIITTQYHAKVVEVTNRAGEEIDIIRDTNQRFWAVVEKEGGGELTYVFKFLTSSVEFPFTIRVDLYERKQDSIGVEVRLHTNNDGHIPLEPESRPLIVFAEVTLDGHPVVGSKVMLKVSHLSEDGSTDMMVELLDSGNTEPDVRAQDGVYSRYLTWLPGEGRYALSAIANDHHGSASVLRPRDPDGHVVPVSTGQFWAASGVLALTVARVTSADLTPPSRVTDLTVTSIHNSTVNLTWSAPGGDLDQGSAWLYELKMYTERSALSEEKFNSSPIAVYCITNDLRTPTQTPASYGTTEYCLTELPFTNLRWYFAIRAVDSSNNTGRISNIVSAFVPDPVTILPPTVPINDSPSNVQTVIMSTVTSVSPYDSQTRANATNRDYSKNSTGDWRVWVAVGVGVGSVVVLVLMCICCCKRSQNNEDKDPDRPVYKIYVNNAYIQEDDGEIKMVSNGRLVDDKEPSQVQEWVNSLSKFGTSDVFGGEHGEPSVAPTDSQVVEGRPRASIKYASPVRFGVLTNGSIMREACASSSSTSSKPSDDPGNEDAKYRDLSETTSNSTTDGGASAASTATTDTVPPPQDSTQTIPINVKPSNSNLSSPQTPSKLLQHPLGIPGSTVISIYSDASHNNGYSSDEEGGFRPRTLTGPGPRRYLPTHFSSFRYLPPPPEYRSAVGDGGGVGPVDYPLCHTIARANATLPHGTVRSVKKRRHISFV